SPPAVRRSWRRCRSCGVRLLLGDESLKPHQPLAFDRTPELLLWPGTRVAPANASPQIRAISNVLTTSNDEHGIARVLENWLGKS
ncbi:MAG: hypothetical protein MKZ59_03975, partial [Deinococcales bacterium]|nr:hypothetical protein [Deinococcales bacterium]